MVCNLLVYLHINEISYIYMNSHNIFKYMYINSHIMSFLHKTLLTALVLEKKNCIRTQSLCTIWLSIFKKIGGIDDSPGQGGSSTGGSLCQGRQSVSKSTSLVHLFNYYSSVQYLVAYGIALLRCLTSPSNSSHLNSSHSCWHLAPLPVSHFSERHPFSHPGTKPASGAASSGRWADGGHLHRQ